jgi:hypothetical protein
MSRRTEIPRSILAQSVQIKKLFLRFAVTSTPRKNLILPQEKSFQTRCLQFAARPAVGVNVRTLRESQTKVKCLVRHWISCRQRGAWPAHRPRMRRKGLKRRPNFTVTRAIRRVVRHKRFHRHAFLSTTTRDEAAKRRHLPSVRRNAPEVCRKTRQGAAVSRPCTLSPSIDADFLVRPIRAS